jgi:hypothetical protein
MKTISQQQAEQKLIELKIENISRVYAGKDSHCRCGCGGNYHSTSFMKNPRSTVNDKVVKRHLTAAKNLLEKEECKIELGDTYINVSYGNNRALTFYTDELQTIQKQ